MAAGGHPEARVACPGGASHDLPRAPMSRTLGAADPRRQPWWETFGSSFGAQGLCACAAHLRCLPPSPHPWHFTQELGVGGTAPWLWALCPLLRDGRGQLSSGQDSALQKLRDGSVLGAACALTTCVEERVGCDGPGRTVLLGPTGLTRVGSSGLRAPSGPHAPQKAGLWPWGLLQLSRP